MFPNSIHNRIRTVLFYLITVLLSASPVLGASPVTKIDLGVNDLTLEAGESYSFRVTYEPEDASFLALKWNISDDSILEIDPARFTVKALRPGTARILAESLDGYAYDICTVNVTGSLPKDTAAERSGSEFITLSAADRGKITSFSIRRYLDFLEGSEMTDASFAGSARRRFMVMAAVTPGTEDAQSRRALSLGMQEAEPLRNLHILTLRGTLEQILRFTASNSDLIEIYEEHLMIADNRAKTEEEDTQKTVTLDGHVEDLTSISTAHELGYTGKGSTIAVIDTGLDPEHPEFTGRVIGQRCFGTEGSDEQFTFHSPCLSVDSANPQNSINSIFGFNHGIHVTGIAAGKGGIAPDANIVAIQVFTDLEWQCTDEDSFFDWCIWEDDKEDKDDNDRMCCAVAANPQDTVKAIDYLIGHAKDYPNLTAVNMSKANSTFHKTACDNVLYFSYFQSLLEHGMIPVLASGNEYSNDSLPESACASNSFTVGALANQTDPLLASFSNHNDLVDMTAPGEHINSAIFPRHSELFGDIYYDTESGTSMAAPMVTGAFAIMKQIFPNRSPEDLEQTLIDLSTKDVTERNACIDYYIEVEICPAEYAQNTRLSAAKPILDFSGLEDFLDEEKDSVVKPVSITIVDSSRPVSADPDVLFTRYFTLTVNGRKLDLKMFTSLYPEVDIAVTKEAGNRVSITISNLPEFDEDSMPLAYAIVPTDDQENISGTIYDGYNIRYISDPEPGQTFFRFPLEMQELPRTGFSSRSPQLLADKPLSINYAHTGLVLQIPSLDVITDIVQVPFADDEYPVQWLGDAAGLLQGSARPGEGVSVLVGHNHLNELETGPFAFLVRLEPGTKLFVLNENNENLSFTVIRNELLAAEDMAVLEAIVNQSDNSLTLLTCENERYWGGYANRRVVVAVPD